jgi:hypothetical protein
VFEFIGSLPSIPTPDASASPLRRAKNLVRLLADDRQGPALLPDADARLTDEPQRTPRRASRRTRRRRRGRRPGPAYRSRAPRGCHPTGQSSDATTRIIDTHAKDIDRDTRKIINSVREGVGKGYYTHRATKAKPTENRLDIRSRSQHCFESKPSSPVSRSR